MASKMSASYEQLLLERDLLYNELSIVKAECEAIKAQFAVKEKEIIRQWILTRITVDIVPPDEGNEENLIKNLLDLLEENDR
jgi:hypothetical protein